MREGDDDDLVPCGIGAGVPPAGGFDAPVESFVVSVDAAFKSTRHAAHRAQQVPALVARDREFVSTTRDDSRVPPTTWRAPLHCAM